MTVNRNITSHLGQRQATPTITSMHSFSICVPTLILCQLLIHEQTTGIQLDINISSLQSNFLNVDHIDIPTLSWLTQRYLGIHEFSEGAILDVVEALIQSAAEAPSMTRLTLLRCYVDLCITLPERNPQAIMLTPIVNVLSRYVTAAAASAEVVASNTEVSGFEFEFPTSLI